MLDMDSQLVSEVLTGSKQSFEKLLEKYDRKIYGYVLKILGDSYAAEDIAQETFIKAYQNLDSFKRGGCFAAWLFAIARNNALNYMKKNKRVGLLKESEDISLSAAEEVPWGNPERVFEEKELYMDISKAIDSLPEKYRELIYLKYVENLSSSEIGKRLGMPPSRVDSRLYMARQKLLKRIGHTRKMEGQAKEYEVQG